ncbi:MAG: Gfo/Idh/MocA family oxidoreductase [Planctomycetota bacterium]
MTTERIINVGVMGLGPNGREHLKNYQRHPNARVVAVCDADEALARRVANERGIANVYTDLGILDQKDIDMVAVCVPNPFHGEYTIRALEAGKHVFVEKPMALEIESLRKIVRLSRKTGLHAMAGQVLRFLPLFRTIKHLITEGIIGEIFYVEGDYIHDLRGYRHLEDPMGSDGVHPLDLLRWYVGEAVEVQAYSNRMIWPELQDPTTVAIYRFASGCIGKVTVLWTPIGPRPTAFNISVYGSKATIRRDEICLAGTDRFVPIGLDPTGHPFDEEDAHFIDCLVQGREPLINTLDGARSAAAVLVVKEAIRERRPVSIPQLEE